MAFAVVVSVFTVSSGDQVVAASEPASAPYELVASPRRAAPGDTLELAVEGRRLRRLLGSAVSTFDQRTRDGWQPIFRLYYLQGPFEGGPDYATVRPLESDVAHVGVGTDIEALVPPVEPGTYRITREFYGSDQEGGITSEKVVALSTRFVVTRCPRGSEPAFVPPALQDAEFGTPGCVKS